MKAMAYNNIIPLMDQCGLTVFLSSGICMCKQKTLKSTLQERVRTGSDKPFPVTMHKLYQNKSQNHIK